MTRKLSLLGVFIGAMLLTGSVAHAAPVLEVSPSGDTTWVSVTTSEVSEGLVVKLLAPKERSTGRSLWQTCRFSGTVAGTHKCGIDTSEGSLAQQREGTWVVKVFAGGTRVARSSFTI